MNIDVAIVGCGWIAQAHLKAWRKARRTHLVAVCDENKHAAARTAEAWKIPAYYDDLDEMLSRHKASIVDICTPPQTHGRLIVQALEMGHHVLVEKPMAVTLKEAEVIMSAQKRSEKKVGVVHNWLFEPAMIKALSMARSGKLGQILEVDVRDLETLEDPMLSNKKHWCHLLPLGRFSEVLPHPIYILQAFLGHLNVKSVLVRKFGKYSWVPFDESFVTLHGEDSFGSAYLSFNTSNPAIFVDVYGTKGMVRVDLIGQTVLEVGRRSTERFSKATENLRQAYHLTASTLRSAILVSSHQWRTAHDTYICAFVDSIIHDRRPPVGLEEAYDNARVMDEIVNAVRTQ